MFDPTKPNDILELEDQDLSEFLPNAEDDRHEYKSSAIKNDKELGDKIAKAASGFWNSGGGLFVVGVDGNGQPDGGISLSVGQQGRQSRRDWIDQAISQVMPKSCYVIHSIENSSNCMNIEQGKAVFLIGFGESEIGPHMANDHRYYIRAGAHTVPAGHFIVEAIHARRGLRTPLLSHIVRLKPGNSGVVQLGIVVLNAAAAINVSIKIDALPKIFTSNLEEKLFLQIPIISEQFPLFFDVHGIMLGRQELPPFEINLTYSDMANRRYQKSFEVDIDRQLGPNISSSYNGYDRIEQELKNITEAIKNSNSFFDAT
ncbi:AlbA family DNA-binding domain-containing protein [Microcoleus sp. OTE_8_concoct_300]|uniref:AlbA family DNA-binding domain-containing protein n=1 Tax=Microcoleus sp. OTE_8_concoct_300 TaxID=2964710 RepID=UPI00403F200B